MSHASAAERFVRRIPEGDDRERLTCTDCGYITYENPKVVVGSIVTTPGGILLCRRAIHPRRGYWTIPAGFMENGETTGDGAKRETLEEANARVEVLDLFALYNIPHISQVYMLFRARLLDLDFAPGEETLELKLCNETEIPWDDIAFATVRNTLTHYFNDKRKGHFSFHIGTIEPMPRRA